jgi:hypothetical protein
MASNDAVFGWCKAQGYPWEWVRNFDGKEDTRTAVVEFPVALPKTAVLAKDMTALGQLEVVRLLQREWADNAVSVTIYYKAEELPGIKAYLENHWDEFKSLSFLLHQEHGFDQAPMEEIDVHSYDQRLAALHWQHVDMHGQALDILDSDCEGGSCPIR